MDGEGRRQTKDIPDSLGHVPANLNTRAAAMNSIGILFKSVLNAECGFPKCKMWANILKCSGEPLRDSGDKQAGKLFLYMKYCNTEFQRNKI